MKIETQDWLYILEKRANRMREKPTPSEKRMAKILDELKIDYKTQWIFGYYIADFYLPSKNAILEVNGGIHDQPDQKLYDKKRTHYFQKAGVQVFVVRNENVATCQRRLLNFIYGKKDAKPKKQKLAAEKKLPSRKPNTQAIMTPIQKVFKRKAEGRFLSERAFKQAYKSAVAKHIKNGIPFMSKQ